MAPPSFAFELMRKAVLGLAVRHEHVRSLINPRQSSAISYRESSLNVADVDPFAAGPKPGAVLPEMPLTILADGAARAGHLTDLVKPRFTVLYFTQNGTVPAELLALEVSLQAQGLPFAVLPVCAQRPSAPTGEYAWDHDGRLFDRYGARVGTLYLIRPDGHVLGRWLTGSAASVANALLHCLSS